MFYSLTGTIIDITDNTIAVQVGPIAYECLVSRVDAFLMGEERTVYCYEVENESEHYLCGFPSKSEKTAFTLLTSVKGIGPKTALSALKETTPDALYRAITANNTAYLKKLPGIGAKAASQIILDLRGHLAAEVGKKRNKVDPSQFDEVRDALKSLGFKSKLIDEALSSIDTPNLNNEEILKLALRRLRKGGVQ